MRAYPTTYGGTNFRSRLEARWAAFFDLVKWSWEYEPSDDGQWTPDFVLQFSRMTMPVEVKPIEWPRDLNCCMAIVDRRKDLEKVRASDRESSLILGAYPIGSFTHDIGFAWWCCYVIGIEGENFVVAGRAWEDAYNYTDYALSRLPVDERLRDAGAHGWWSPKWKQAGNAVQWRAPRQA